MNPSGYTFKTLLDVIIVQLSPRRWAVCCSNKGHRNGFEIHSRHASKSAAMSVATGLRERHS